MTVAAPGRRVELATKRPVSLSLFVGFTVAATGGPLALVALYAPGAVSSVRSLGLISVLAAVVFVAPLLVWWRYSERVASAGGLFSFVEAGAGRPLALVQGGVWIVSYALYLPYTVDYIVYDVLPVALPGVKPYQPLLEILLPAVIAGLGFVAMRQAMGVVAALAVGQMVVLLLFTTAGLAHLGTTSHAFGAHGSVISLAKGTGNVALLFICSSLALFLGSETVGGGRTIRLGLPAGFGIVAAAVIVGVLPWARAGAAELKAPIPGVVLAQDAWGHWFGVVVGLGVAASTAGVIIAEFFALTRLVHAMVARPLSQTTLGGGSVLRGDERGGHGRAERVLRRSPKAVTGRPLGSSTAGARRVPAVRRYPRPRPCRRGRAGSPGVGPGGIWAVHRPQLAERHLIAISGAAGGRASVVVGQSDSVISP